MEACGNSFVEGSTIFTGCNSTMAKGLELANTFSALRGVTGDLKVSVYNQKVLGSPKLPPSFGNVRLVLLVARSCAFRDAVSHIDNKKLT